MSAENLRQAVRDEIQRAQTLACTGDETGAFSHLERAHVLGQAITREHTRVHWLMLRSAVRQGDVREIIGQIIRVVGAATKTPLGIYPVGNTGGANVWFFKSMSIPSDLKEIIDAAQRKGE